MVLGNWVDGPKILLKSPKYRKNHWKLGLLMVSSSKTVRSTRTIFLHHADNDNLHIKNPLGFIWGYILMYIFHFPCLFLSAPKNMEKCISVTHHGNQCYISPPIILQCGVYGVIPKYIVLTTILLVCNFPSGHLFLRYDHK